MFPILMLSVYHLLPLRHPVRYSFRVAASLVNPWLLFSCRHQVRRRSLLRLTITTCSVEADVLAKERPAGSKWTRVFESRSSTDRESSMQKSCTAFQKSTLRQNNTTIVLERRSSLPDYHTITPPVSRWMRRARIGMRETLPRRIQIEIVGPVRGDCFCRDSNSCTQISRPPHSFAGAWRSTCKMRKQI